MTPPGGFLPVDVAVAVGRTVAVVAVGGVTTLEAFAVEVVAGAAAALVAGSGSNFKGWTSGTATLALALVAGGVVATSGVEAAGEPERS